MTFRRTVAALPLAVAVAVVAHVAGFGSDHAPSGDHAGLLAALLVTSLAAGLAVAFGRGLGGRPPRSIATQPRPGYPYLVVGLAVAAFLGLELLEGHLGIGAGTLRSLAALGPLAFVVSTVAAALTRVAEGAGREVAATARRLPRIAANFAPRATARAYVFAPAPRPAATRGRAPPAHP